MTEQTTVGFEGIGEDMTDKSEAIIRCKSCGQIVPRTNMCLYCGAPILFRKLTEP